MPGKHNAGGCKCCNTCNCAYEASDGNAWADDFSTTLDAGWTNKWPAYDSFGTSGGRLNCVANSGNPNNSWSALYRTASLTPGNLNIIIQAKVYSNPNSATTGIIFVDGLQFRMFARWGFGGIGLYAFGSYYTYSNTVASGDTLTMKFCNVSDYQFRVCYFLNSTLIHNALGTYAFGSSEQYGVVATSGWASPVTFPSINGTWDDFSCHIGNP